MESSIKLNRKLGVWSCAFAFYFLCPALAQAQNWNEIFRQKKTQEKYLLQQITYLRLYANQAWKGYKLVSGGLETIDGFTSGEFNLHEAFISALSKVSLLVRKDFRVAEILKFQLAINSSFRVLQKSAALGPASNLEYYNSVQEKVLAECDADLGEILDLVLSGDMEMNDADRLGRLAKIHASIREKSAFTRWFCAEAALLAQSQERKKMDIEDLRRFYGQD